MDLAFHMEAVHTPTSCVPYLEYVPAALFITKELAHVVRILLVKII